MTFALGSPQNRSGPGRMDRVQSNMQEIATCQCDGDSVQVFVEGDTLYDAMRVDIAAARQSIDLEAYILGDDVVGRAFVAALCERAAAGGGRPCGRLGRNGTRTAATPGALAALGALGSAADRRRQTPSADALDVDTADLPADPHATALHYSMIPREPPTVA